VGHGVCVYVCVYYCSPLSRLINHHDIIETFLTENIQAHGSP
jgi:hypothetical protein